MRARAYLGNFFENGAYPSNLFENGAYLSNFGRGLSEQEVGLMRAIILKMGLISVITRMLSPLLVHTDTSGREKWGTLALFCVRVELSQLSLTS